MTTLLVVMSSMAGAKASPRLAGDDAGIGEVRTSLLSNAEFIRAYGPDWVLMAGQPVNDLPQGSFRTLNLMGITRIPDARGKFLRMSNNGACTNPTECLARGLDPKPNRAIGSSQPASVQPHNHTIPAQFSTSHAHNDGGNHKWVFKDRYPGGEKTTPGKFKTDSMIFPASYEGVPETRPANISVNFFVRVACTTSNYCSR